MDKSKKRNKIKNKFKKGIVFINSTLNNTIISISNLRGDTISWASAGTCGFKGSRKSTPFAAQIAAEKLMSNISNLSIRIVKILIKGPGLGRESVIRIVEGSGLKISLIKDITPLPHNGCRPPKKRRI